MNSRRLQSWLLRVAGAVETLAFGAVLMPRSWMEASRTFFIKEAVFLLFAPKPLI